MRRRRKDPARLAENIDDCLFFCVIARTCCSALLIMASLMSNKLLFSPCRDPNLGKCSGASCRFFACLADYTGPVHYLSAIKIVPAATSALLGLQMFFRGLQLPGRRRCPINRRSYADESCVYAKFDRVAPEMLHHSRAIFHAQASCDARKFRERQMGRLVFAHCA